MVIIFDATTSRQPNRSFGRGLARYAGQHTNVAYTAADAAWAAESFGNRPAGEPDYDRMGLEASLQAAADAGYRAF